MFRKIANKLLAKSFKVDRSKFYGESIPDNMVNITDQVPFLFNDCEVFTDDINYLFAIEGKVVYVGNVDNDDAIATINADMIQYPVLINSVMKQTLDQKADIDMIDLLLELKKNNAKGNVELISGKDKTTIKFNPTK